MDIDNEYEVEVNASQFDIVQAHNLFRNIRHLTK